MAEKLQIALTKEEFKALEQDLNMLKIKFKYCNKHQQYERNFGCSNSFARNTAIINGLKNNIK